jgi:hypothetical protein
MPQRAAQRIGWLWVLPLIASCSGRAGSNHPPVSAASTGGTLTVSWSAPTRNSDGSQVAELTGYTIYYGRGSKAYETSMAIDDPSATRAVIRGLQPGVDYYFAVVARNAAGGHSLVSPEVHGKARVEN